MEAWGGGVAVLLSSYAQELQNADAVSKIKNSTSSQKRSSMSTWLHMRTKPVWGTLQLWIFLSRDTTGAIKARMRRVGCQ